MKLSQFLLLLSITTTSNAFTPNSIPQHSITTSYTTSSSSTQLQTQQSPQNENDSLTRRNMFQITATSLLLATTMVPTQEAQARLEAVNRPDLLPKEEGLNVIQVEKFLTSGQAKRMNEQLGRLEKDTGYRVKVLCQSYPNTPGLAIRDYWDLGKEGQKDDKYIVLVVDQFGGKGNVLNFNVGDGVKFALPNVFWTRLQGKYGSTFFVKENGIDLAITNAIDAIVQCLRTEEQFCVNVPDQGLLGLK